MESTFILILMSAGVLVAVLGAILFTSERELKGKRRQIEELLTKLESLSQGGTLASPLPAESSAELAEIRSQNRDLQNQLQALSGKLELSEKTIDELRATAEENSADPAETARLKAANDQLQTQLAQLRERLASSEAEIQNTAGQSRDSQETHARLQSEVAELRQQLDARQEKISALEAAQKNVPDVEAIEASHRQERQALQERITELEQRMQANQELVSEAQALRQRLIEAEESQKSLREEVQRHEEEIPRWQARIAEGEEHRERLVALREPLDALLTKEASIAEQQRQLQEDLGAFARMMATPVDTAARQAPDEANHPADTSAFGAATHQADSVGSVRPFKDEGEFPTVQQPRASVPPDTTHEPIAAASEPETKRARSYGIFGLLILLAASGATAFHFLGSGSVLAPAEKVAVDIDKPTAQINPKAEPTESLDLQSSAAALETPSVKEVSTSAPVDSHRKTAAPARQAAKIEARVAGTYQITRPGRVYTAPSEASQPIGDIDAGVKVNVVNSRDGWLEIHSKHGRPPGFIRREYAARVDN